MICNLALVLCESPGYFYPGNLIAGEWGNQMTTLTSNISVTLNGSTPFKVGVDPYNWSKNWLLYVDTWVEDSLPVRTATYTLEGSGWNIDMFRFTGQVKAVIKDNTDGTGGSVGFLALGALNGAGSSVATFNRTYVDIVKGSGNAETLTLGAAGAGQIELGGGNDSVKTGTGYVDYISVGHGANKVTIGSGGAGVVRAGEDRDIIKIGSGAEIDSIDAGRGNDSITTSSGWIGTISGGRGKDTISLGSGGADAVFGGRDADTVTLRKLAEADQFVIVDGGSGVSTGADRNSDTLVMSSFTRKLDIDLGISDVVDTGNGIFLVRNFEHVSGGSKNDVLTGNSASNTLRGNGGNDTITGMKGADALYGGKGRDVFVFESISDSKPGSSGRDTIFDFSKSQRDKLDLSAIDANTKKSGDQAFEFVGSKKFSGDPGELRVSKSKSDTYVYADVNGDKKADFGIHLDDALSLSKGDFIL
ncbi:hypothetical protein OCK02_19795 [Rhizobium sp. TRM96647]|uniref:calcium-binding protein n=1 Tax=unclassified Rhizobium TaxID=2613769 RepID=UPI0021E6E11B|nr:MULTISPECIES: calcium-binding protein [unclassified Rhizobium]MCV3738454.1 hypothetical protein [Rhizobium sp. TRM96647]